jgi:hypothetical protein
MISNKNITFVVQGVLNNTQLLINDIRRYFPGSQIIVSTWFTDVIDIQKYDKLVLSEDPGGFKNQHSYQNVNRQIVSSAKGLESVKTEYCVKIRSDMRIVSDNLFSIFDTANKLKRPNIVKNKNWVICCNLTSYNIDVVAKPFNICDWIFAGNTKDILNFFDINYYPQEYFEYFEFAPNIYGDFTQQRYSAEQWIIMNRYLEDIKHHSLTFKYGFDSNERVLDFHLKVLANDIFVCSMSKLGMASSKYKVFNFGMSRMLTNNEWYKNYIMYNNLELSTIKKLMLNVDFDRLFYNIISNKKLRKIIKIMFKK